MPQSGKGNSRPPSIRTLADRTGLSTATVSMALRGVGRIPETTREKVRRAAEELGYQVSPIFSRAFKMARHPDRTLYRETLGLICEYSVERPPPFQRIIHQNVEACAKALGYRIDAMQITDKPADHRRANAVLQARGIRGLIVLPRLTHRYPRLHLDWSKYAGVEIGRTLWNPINLHRIERSVYHEILEVVHLLKRAGYRRIGLAVEPMAERQRQMVYSAAFDIAQQHLPRAQKITPLLKSGSWTEESFHKWFKQQEPDVLIIHDNHTVPGWLRSLGVRTPEDVSIFSCDAREFNHSGIVSNVAMFGRNSIEMLSILLESERIGTSDAPYNWLVKSLWCPGGTLKRPIAPPSNTTQTAKQQT